MNRARDITQDLQDWLREPDRLPPPRISEVAPLVHRTPQDRGWVSPLIRRFPALITATSSLVAATVVALVGGFLLMGMPNEPTDELSADSAAVEPASTDGLPRAVVDEMRDRGTITSPDGTLAWERIRDTSAPRFGESWSWLGGSVVVRDADDGGLFISPDGTEWTRLALPDLPTGVPPRILRPAHGDGVAWLVAPADTGPEGRQCRRRPDSQAGDCQDRPVMAWRTVGDGAWERLESGSWPRPGPAGFEWEPQLRDVVSNGDVTIALEDAQGVFPGALWASDIDCAPRLRKDGDGYLLVSEEIEDGCPTASAPIRLRVTEQDGGLVVADRDSGKAVRIAGADRAVLDRLVDDDRYGISAPERLVVIAGGRVSYVAAPWPVDEDAGASLFAADGAFYAYVPVHRPARTDPATPWGVEVDAEAEPVGRGAVWRSENGIEWSELEAADAPDLIGAAETRVHADARVVYVRDDEGVLAASLDGLGFAMRPEGSPQGSQIIFTPLGWVAVERYFETFPGQPQIGDAVWLHQADEWVPLTPLGFDCGIDDDGEPSSVGWVGETIFIAARGCDSQPGDTASDIWLIRQGGSS